MNIFGKKDKVKCVFTINITSASYVTTQKPVYVIWKRGSGKDTTGHTKKEFPTASGSVLWDESFTIESTLEQDVKSKKFEEKHMSFSLQEADKDKEKSIGKVILNLGEYANNNHKESKDFVLSKGKDKKASLQIGISTQWKSINGKLLVKAEPGSEKKGEVVHLGGTDYYFGGADEMSEKSDVPDTADEPADDDDRSSSSDAKRLSRSSSVSSMTSTASASSDTDSKHKRSGSFLAKLTSSSSDHKEKEKKKEDDDESSSKKKEKKEKKEKEKKEKEKTEKKEKKEKKDKEAKSLSRQSSSTKLDASKADAGSNPSGGHQRRPSLLSSIVSDLTGGKDKDKEKEKDKDKEAPPKLSSDQKRASQIFTVEEKPVTLTRASSTAGLTSSSGSTSAAATPSSTPTPQAPSTPSTTASSPPPLPPVTYLSPRSTASAPIPAPTVVVASPPSANDSEAVQKLRTAVSDLQNQNSQLMARVKQVEQDNGVKDKQLSVLMSDKIALEKKLHETISEKDEQLSVLEKAMSAIEAKLLSTKKEGDVHLDTIRGRQKEVEETRKLLLESEYKSQQQSQKLLEASARVQSLESDLAEQKRKFEELSRQHETLVKRTEEKKRLDEEAEKQRESNSSASASADEDAVTALREKMANFYSELTNQLQADVESEKKARQTAENQLKQTTTVSQQQKLALEKEVDARKGSISTLQNSIQAKDRELERIREKFEELQKQKAAAPAPPAAVVSVDPAQAKELKKAQEEKATLEAEVKQLQQQLQQAASAQTSSRKSDAGESSDSLKSLNQDQKALAKRIDELERQFHKLPALVPVASTKETESLAKKLAEEQSRVKQLEAQLKQQQQQQAETSEKIIIADIDPEQEASERVSELEQRVKQLEEELSKAKRTNLNKSGNVGSEVELADARQKIADLQTQLAASSSALTATRSTPSLSQNANGNSSSTSNKKEKDDWEFLEKNIYAAEMASAKLGSYQIPAAAAAITHHLLDTNAFSPLNSALISRTLSAIELSSKRNKRDKNGIAYWLSSAAHMMHLLACEKLIQTDPKTVGVAIVKESAELLLSSSSSVSAAAASTFAEVSSASAAEQQLKRLLCNLYVRLLSAVYTQLQSALVAYFFTDAGSVAILDSHMSHMKKWASGALLQCLIETANALKDAHFFPAIANQFWTQVFYYIDAFVLNQLFERHEKCSAARGVQLKMALSQLEDWVSGNGLGFLRESKESSQKSSLDPAATPLLAHVIEAANVFLVDKNIFLSEEHVRTTFPHLNAMQISRLLDMFVQDELSPAPIPGTAKSALLSMKTRLPTKTTNLTLDTTYLLSTAAAKEKEKW